MKNSSRFYALIIVLFLSGCTGKPAKDYLRLSGFAQGTTYSIIYYDSKSRDLSKEIEEIFQNIDSSMSVYRPESIINAFNSSQYGIEVDTLLVEVVKLSLGYSVETNGAFDITVGPLVNAWGFQAKRGEMPTENDIELLKRNIGYEKISLDGLFLKKNHPDVKIDVNAVAQGYTVDVLSEFLESNGIEDYLVELGGEIRTSGKSPRQTQWVVAVDKPVDDAISGEEIQVKISITNYALVTSGNYRKFFIKDGVKYSHTIDPKTGYPVSHTMLSATVLDKKGARADALATAFMVMGLEKTKEWLKIHSEVEAYIVYSNSKGEYEVWMSEGIKSRIIQ